MTDPIDSNLIWVDHYTVTQNTMWTCFRTNIEFTISWWGLWKHKPQEKKKITAISFWTQQRRRQWRLGSSTLSDQVPHGRGQQSVWGWHVARCRNSSINTVNKVEKENKTWVAFQNEREQKRNKWDLNPVNSNLYYIWISIQYSTSLKWQKY